jgi:hypothetical protein
MDSRFVAQIERQRKSCLATRTTISRSRITVNKSPIASRMTQTSQRKTLAKRRQQIEDWISAQVSVRQRFYSIEMESEIDRKATQSTAGDIGSLFDPGINVDGVYSISEDDLGSSPAAREEIQLTTEEVSPSLAEYEYFM